MAELRTGTRFGDWVLSEYLAGGGNGVVWAATRSDGTRGAMKFLHPKHYKDRKRVLRFESEVEAMRSCQDIRGVLPLLDDSKTAITNPTVHWFVAALAEPLESVLRADQRLQLVVEACASFAGTLQQMHERGFSHRDIKPDNLFKHNATWCIGDFGLVDFPTKSAITGRMEKLGPMFYIAPEMLNDARHSDGRPADVYSLAKTLWKLASGQRYPLPGVQQTLVAALTISAYVAEPDAFLLDAVIEQATQLDPRARLSMKEFKGELDAWHELKKTSVDSTRAAVEIRLRRKKMQAESEFADQLEIAKRALIERQVNELLLPSFERTVGTLSHRVRTLLLNRGLHVDEVEIQSNRAYEALNDAVNLDTAARRHLRESEPGFRADNFRIDQQQEDLLAWNGTRVNGVCRGMSCEGHGDSAKICYLALGLVVTVDWYRSPDHPKSRYLDHSTLALEGWWVYEVPFPVGAHYIWSQRSFFAPEYPSQAFAVRNIASALEQNTLRAADVVEAFLREK
jgi:hypothetical protein